MTIFKAVLSRIFKSKVRFLILLVLPLISIYMWAAQSYDGMAIGIVDSDHSPTSQKIIGLIKNIDRVKIVEANLDNMEDLTASYYIEYTIVIDSGFERDLIAGNAPKLREYYIDEKERTFFIQNRLNQELGSLNMLAKAVSNDPVRYHEALKEYSKSALTVASENNIVNRNSTTRLAFGFLIQFMLYMSVLTAGIILEDKSKGTFYRTFCAPVSLKRYMAENMLAFFLTAVLQPLFIILAMKYFFHMYFGNHLLMLLGIFLVFALFCVTLGLFITAILKKPAQAYIVIVIITTPIIMLGGCYWDMNFMPDIMQKIANLIPVSYVMRVIDAVLNGSVTSQLFLNNCFILIIFSAIFLALGLMKKVDIAK